MSDCRNKRAPVEHVILFLSSGYVCFWSVSLKRLESVDTHTTYAYVWGNDSQREEAYQHSILVAELLRVEVSA